MHRPGDRGHDQPFPPALQRTLRRLTLATHARDNVTHRHPWLTVHPCCHPVIHPGWHPWLCDTPAPVALCPARTRGTQPLVTQHLTESSCSPSAAGAFCIPLKLNALSATRNSSYPQDCKPEPSARLANTPASRSKQAARATPKGSLRCFVPLVQPLHSISVWVCPPNAVLIDISLHKSRGSDVDAARY